MSEDKIEISSDGRTYTLDLRSEELFRERQERIRLTRQQWALLRFFVENSARLVKKEELHGSHWAGVPITDEAISQAIRNLRSALGDQRSNSFIRTEHGRGYRFVGEVKRIKPDTAVLNPVDDTDPALSIAEQAARFAAPEMFLSVSYPGRVVIKTLIGVACAMCGLKTGDVVDIHVSVAAEEDEPTLRFDHSASFLSLESGERVAIPERAIETVAKTVATNHSGFLPLCVALDRDDHAMRDYDENLAHFTVQFCLIRDPSGLLGSGVLSYATEILVNVPCVAGHLWNGRIDTFDCLRGDSIGAFLIKKIIEMDALPDLMDSIEKNGRFYEESFYSLIQFGWYLVEKHPDIAAEFKDRLANIFTAAGCPESLIQATKKIAKVVG